MMEFRILGPIEVLSDGVPIDLGPHRQRALLALLLLRVGRVVSTERILEELWGDDAAGKESALWVHISRLRSALEPGRSERGQSSVLLTRDHGYMLHADPDSVDARRFDAALKAARALLKDDPDTAAAILRDALALWSGTALQDFTYDEFAQDDILRLEELHREALESRIDADLRRGLAAELVTELEALLMRHPLRERPVAQLMNALYRAGRQADALRAFQRFRRTIGDQLGTEPSPELCRLEEQVLLHDARLMPNRPDAASVLTTESTNPFKGLHPFRESDAEDFFGRDRLTKEVVARISDGNRLVGLVGPSGSGKSSVVRAGVVPAIHKGAIAGSERWAVASMVPGAHPFAELEAALLRSTLDAPDNLGTQLEDEELGLLRAVLRVLPDDDTRMVLVIDQFEELFDLVANEQERRRFLANLVTGLDDPGGRLIVVLTLRADSYHRPLMYANFAARLAPAVVHVLPLSSDELEAAAQEPAARRGVALEPALLAELLTDVIGEPGALPIFQYALTELYDRRVDQVLTVASYRAMGGVRGALSRRADDLFHRLTLDEQEVTRQLFLRLATISDNDEWGRRRVLASEIIEIDVDVVTMERVIRQFGTNRFLAFDRDHATGAPTVEVAHEALLREWGRLASWIDEARRDVQRRDALHMAMSEWARADHDADYLLTGNRLAEYERWRGASSMRLTATEHDFLDRSVARSDQTRATLAARDADDARRRRRSRRLGWTAVAVAVVAAFVAAVVIVPGSDSPAAVALVYEGRGVDLISDLQARGFEQAADLHDITQLEVTPPFTDLFQQISDVAARADLVVLTFTALGVEDVAALVADNPDTTFAYIDGPPLPGVVSIGFAEHEGSFLVGAAAALTSETGVVGFIGGFQFSTLERFRAGFEAGARAVDPSIQILARYVALDPSGFRNDSDAKTIATDMYARGADVIFAAAGLSGAGVFEAARESSATLGRHVWAAGVDADEYFSVDPVQRAHVLTSMVKRFDLAVYKVVDEFVEGGHLEHQELGLADGGVDYSTSGDHLTAATIARLEDYREEIVAGARVVPAVPSGPLEPPFGKDVTDALTVVFDGTSCRALGPTVYDHLPILEVEFVNTSPVDEALVLVLDSLVWQVPASASGRNRGFVTVPAAGTYQTVCAPEPWDGVTTMDGPILDVRP